MAVSPADFYAYSQATGTPVPQDKRSQALLAPAVFQWRKSQLQRAENEGNVVDTVGKVALGAGALAGGGFGARRLVRALRSSPQTAQKVADTVTDEAAVRNAAAGVIDTRNRSGTVDLSQKKQSLDNLVAEQALDAGQSSSDQLDQIAESALQRDTDSIKYGKAQVLQEEIRDAQIRETKPGFTPDYTKKGLTQADLDVLNQTQVGKVLQSERYGGELSPQGDIEIRTRSGSEGLSAASTSAVYTTDSLKARPGITGQEIRDRTLAAAKFDRGSTEQNLLLNPNVATEDVRDLLTTTYVETPRGGYINPTDEVIGGARASMTEVDNLVDDALIGSSTPENLEAQMSSAGFLDEFIDKDMDGSRGVVGTGGPLRETKSYVERIRGKGTTNVPGQVELVDSPGTIGSTRQERQLDEVISTRSDAGEVGTGVLFKDDPEISVLDTITDKPRTTKQTDVLDRQLTLEGSAKRDLSAWANDPRYLNEYGEVDPKKIPLRERLQAPLISNDVNIEGSKKVGNIESVAPEQAFTLGQQADGSNISIIQGTQKDPNRLIVVRNQRGQGGKPITQQIWDMPEADNLLTFNQTIESGSDVLNTQPYMFGVVERDPRTGQEYLGTRAKRGPLLQRVTNTRGQTELRPTQVSRSDLKNIADQASTRWEAPGVKQAWMEANAPEAVDPRTKAFVEKPYHKNTFIAQQLKQQLAQGKVVKKADIPIVKTKPMLTGDGRVLPGQNIAIGPAGPEKTTRVGQIDLPVLDDTRSGAADRFVQDLMRTSGDSEFRGRPLPEGPNLRARKKLVDWEADKVVVPGVTRETKGLGGIDPMQLEDAASSENVAYFTPRLESKPPQQKPDTLPSQRKELWDVGNPAPPRVASQDSIDDLNLKVDNLANSLLNQSAKSARRAGKRRGR
tara:strand:+ start:918 stop:3629 length:2712 start_codon:yes stop_codon:yes gene_type:complete